MHNIQTKGDFFYTPKKKLSLHCGDSFDIIYMFYTNLFNMRKGFCPEAYERGVPKLETVFGKKHQKRGTGGA